MADLFKLSSIGLSSLNMMYGAYGSNAFEYGFDLMKFKMFRFLQHSFERSKVINSDEKATFVAM